MKKAVQHIFLILCICGTITSHAQKFEIIKYADLEQMISQPNDTTYVVNFWATWCKPCMAELKYFDTLGSQLLQQKVKVILVSLDFLKEQANLQETLRKHNITSSVVLLNEPDYDSWINKISTEWSGAIPATLMINPIKKKRFFYERAFDAESLTAEITKVLAN